jgi:hypothetical protein
MKAHIVHDAAGAIKSVVLQATEVEGELEISTDVPGVSVTVVDLADAAAAAALERLDDVAGSDEALSGVVSRIRSEFKIAGGYKGLERLTAH